MDSPDSAPKLSFLHPEGDGVRILTLDGADARCLSQLIMLEELMRNLEYDYGRSVRPCEFFHSIVGVGAAGVVAILLGVLGMTIEEASNAFTAICEQVFSSNTTDATTRSKELALAMERILEELNIPCDTRLEADNNRAAGCLVSICYSSASINGCRMLRNYKSRHLSHNPTIVEAAQVSWATPGLLSSVSLGASSRQEELISAVNGFNNPTLEALQEAREIYGTSRSVSTLLSLGCGKTGPVGIRSDQLLKKTVQETEITEEHIERDLGPSGVYYRFSPEHAIDDEITAVDGSQVGLMIAYTHSYLERTKTRRAMNNYLKASAYTSTVDLQFRGRAQNADVLLEPRSISSQPSQAELVVLDTLRVTGLEYDSPLPGCMTGTRGNILRKVDDWTNDLTAPNILWIKGYPGVGKSAIATDVVERLTAVKRLGSSFFFQRQNTTLSPKVLWRKVSYDLSKKHLPIRKIVFARLTAGDVSPGSANLDRIFRHYVHEPLDGSTEIPDARAPVVVIDALDECGGLEGQTSDLRRVLLRNIQSWLSLPPKFKLIITSRGEGDIERLFSETNHRLIEISAGQTVDAQSSEDIRTFLREQLRHIAARYPKTSSNANWPDEQVIEQMVIMAAGLFIWAETAIKFISRGEPRRRLQQVLQGGVDGNIVNLYKQVLDASFGEATKDEMEEFRSIIGAVILAKDPIPFTSLSSLLSIEEFNVEHICNGLQSVLEFQSIVRFNHQSFVDFLLDQSKCPSGFFIDPEIENRKVALACFRVMQEELRFNICGIETSYFRNVDIANLESGARKNIQPHLRYASCHWDSHLAATTFDEEVFEYLSDFMENLFLYWLEVLSITRTVNRASPMLLSLTKWIRACCQNSLLKMAMDMAIDMEKFVASFAAVISQSAPHIYLSALSFSPSSSKISRRYSLEYSQTIKIETGGLKTWPAVQKSLTAQPFVNSVTFSPDGRRVISSSYGTIQIWDAETGDMVMVPLKWHTNTVDPVMFSPDVRHIVSGSGDGMIRTWDAETGDMVIEPFEGHENRVSSVAFSPDRRCIVSGSEDGIIQIWDAKTGDMVMGPLEGHEDSVTSVAFSPDGRRIVSGSWDETIRIWDAETGELVMGPLKGHTDYVQSVRFSPDGRCVVSGSRDKTIRIWDVKTGEMAIGPLEGHKASVESVAYSPDGRRIISGSNDKTIRIWDAETGDLFTGPFEGHTGGINSVAFSPDGRRFVSGSSDNTIRIWNAEASDMVTGSLQGHNDTIDSVAFSPDGRRVVSGSWDNTIQIWDAETGDAVIDPLEGHKGRVNSVAFSPDGKRIASGSFDKTIRIWDAETGKLLISPLQGHENTVYSVAFSPAGRHIVSASWDKTIRIWDVETGGMVIGPLKGHDARVNSVAYSPDGRRVVSGSDDKTIRIWDTETGDMVIDPLKGHDDQVNSVTYSPDGRRIVSGSRDKTIRVWDAETGESLINPLEGHESTIESVSFSPDGRHIVSGSWDKTIRIWNAGTGETIIGPLLGHENIVASVAFSLDGERIVSGSWDDTVRIWDVQNGEVATSHPKRQNQSIDSVGIYQPKEGFPSDSADSISCRRNLDACSSVAGTTSPIPFFDCRCSMVDGWILGQNDELLFWVPPDLRSRLSRPGNTLTISKVMQVRLNLTSFVHGRSWILCKARKNACQ